MSTYNSNSEIVRFNNSTEYLAVTDGLKNILKISREYTAATNGAFDITVAPLVELWGFKNFNNNWVPPIKSDIDSLLRFIGNEHWYIDKSTIYKRNKDLKIDLNAIAKGYGVDQIAKYLLSLGYKSFIVEIGGEVYCHGLKYNVKPWKVGIELPDFSSGNLLETVSLENFALATSGDYRNYYNYKGRVYSHIINPQIGSPVEHNLVSATVIAPTCLEADVLATALMVMGVDKAITFINKSNNVECLLVQRFKDNTLKISKSKGFDQFITN